ncbi:hypothetical protein K6W36_12200 [Acetobacter senegalensis]|uniref:hypothetical protein n=1 Tax=Acetobacter senegalensis TaxID=446692 RepID=UPI001EDB0E5B|nr:hypothetical protein [Acetobacter senegalensis]MCG4261326.1 hypothetical protein [Acetobacter senegalensis]
MSIYEQIALIRDLLEESYVPYNNNPDARSQRIGEIMQRRGLAFVRVADLGGVNG